MTGTPAQSAAVSACRVDADGLTLAGFAHDGRALWDAATHSPTSICVITAIHPDGERIAMIVGSFVSISMAPPLVGYFAQRSSATYARLGECETFAVSVLGRGQEDLVRALSVKGAQDKLAGLDTFETPHGLPVLADSVAWFDCRVASVARLGDHDLVVGEVREFSVPTPVVPLVYFQGSIGQFRSGASALENGAAVLPVVRVVEQRRDDLDRLAALLGREVVVFARIGDELIAVAAAGKEPDRTTTVLGRRFPFAPPFGCLLLDHEADFERWAGRSRRAAGTLDWTGRLEVARQRGASVALVSESHPHFDAVVDEFSRGSHTPDLHRRLLAAMGELEDNYEPEVLPPDRAVRAVQVRARIQDIDILVSVHGLAQEISAAECPFIVTIMREFAATLR